MDSSNPSSPVYLHHKCMMCEVQRLGVRDGQLNAVVAGVPWYKIASSYKHGTSRTHGKPHQHATLRKVGSVSAPVIYPHVPRCLCMSSTSPCAIPLQDLGRCMRSCSPGAREVARDAVDVQLLEHGEVHGAQVVLHQRLRYKGCSTRVNKCFNLRNFPVKAVLQLIVMNDTSHLCLLTADRDLGANRTEVCVDPRILDKGLACNTVAAWGPCSASSARSSCTIIEQSPPLACGGTTRRCACGWWNLPTRAALVAATFCAALRRDLRLLRRRSGRAHRPCGRLRIDPA